MLDLYNYIGGAIRKPLALENGKPTVAQGLSVIEQSILDILHTPRGSKLFLPEYGSRLDEILFEPNDRIVAGLLRQFVKEPINTWERRVRFQDAEIVSRDSSVTIRITYVVLASNEVKSFVFPYYDKIVH